MRCVKKRCYAQAVPGYARCETCLRSAREAAKRRRQRPGYAEYRESIKPQALAAVRNWTTWHPERKRLHGDLSHAVAKGEVVKPIKCQSCKKVAKPIVAFGLDRGDDGKPTIEAWYCWGCWWKQRRVAEGRSA